MNYLVGQIEFVSILDNPSFRLNCLGPLCHHLNWLQIWPPDGATKFGHQVMSLALLGSKVGHQVTRVATLPWNALLALSVSIEFASSSARVASGKSAKRCCIEREADP